MICVILSHNKYQVPNWEVLAPEICAIGCGLRHSTQGGCRYACGGWTSRVACNLSANATSKLALRILKRAAILQIQFTYQVFEIDLKKPVSGRHISDEKRCVRPEDCPEPRSFACGFDTKRFRIDYSAINLEMNGVSKGASPDLKAKNAPQVSLYSKILLLLSKSSLDSG